MALIQLSPIQSLIISGLFLGASNIFVKLLPNIPVIEIIFFRSIIMLALSLPFVRTDIFTLKKNTLFLLLLRGFFGTLGLYYFFTAISKMPLGLAVTFLYMSPLFSLFFAILINKEYPKPIQFLFLSWSLFGVYIMNRGIFELDAKTMLGAMASGLFSGLAYNIIRKLKNSASTHMAMFFFPVVTLPLIVPMLPAIWVTPHPQEYFYLLLVGLGTQGTQFFLTKAYANEKISKLVHYNYLTVCYALLADVFIFAMPLDLTSYIGIIIIFSGIYLSAKAGR